MSYSFYIVCAIACLIGFAPARALASESCKEVRLDANKAILAGKTKDSETEFTCFRLSVKQGTTLRLKVIYAASQDMAFNIADIIDNQDEYTFLAKENSYRIDVYNTFRRFRPGPFKILVTVVKSSSDATKTIRPRNGTTWTANANDRTSVVNAYSLSANSQTILYLSCNKSLKSFGLNIAHYPGRALTRIDDADSRIMLNVTGEDGSARTFSTTMHYYAPDEEWVSSDGPAGFLDALQTGEVLSVGNDKGDKVADFQLRGAAAVRTLMRDVCAI